MPRLRTTTALSLLLLAGGTAGTAWLSGRGGDWVGPPSAHVAGHVAPATRHRPAVAQAPRETPPQRPRWPAIVSDPTAGDADHLAAMAETAAPTLRPLATPTGSAPYQSLRGHLSGSLVLRLRIDGEGRVAASSVARSSGDPILDEHAMTRVRDWRFAVPPEHPEGLSGELPMRFDGEVGAQP